MGIQQLKQTWQGRERDELQDIDEIKLIIPGESFLGTSAEITFQHRNRRLQKNPPKTKKSPTIFNSAEI